jgi:hypothetical protein
MSRLLGLLIGILLMSAGFMMIVGAKKKWSWLVDLPTESWMFNGFSFMKKCFGKTFLIYFN